MAKPYANYYMLIFQRKKAKQEDTNIIYNIWLHAILKSMSLNKTIRKSRCYTFSNIPPPAMSHLGQDSWHLTRGITSRIQPSSVISGETQDYPMSISLHPEVGGVNCPQVVPPSPPIVMMPRPSADRQQTSRCMLTEMKPAYGAHYTIFLSVYTGEKKIQAWNPLSFFFFPFFPSFFFFSFACPFVSQFTSFTVYHKTLFTHGPKFHPRHTY